MPKWYWAACNPHALSGPWSIPAQAKGQVLRSPHSCPSPGWKKERPGLPEEILNSEPMAISMRL
eukprot:5234806-Alexandrium_andersonii.AAC.1